jgi:hypothetical protein
LKYKRLKFVQPIISEEQSREIFSKGKKNLLRKKGEIVRIELINFPYYIFEITAESKRGEKKNYVSVDGIRGTFSFLDFKNIIFLEDGKKSFYFEIKEKEAKEIAKTEYKGEILKSGLIEKNPAELIEVSKGEKIYYPFWVCYYKRKNKYNFQAIDGISGKMQGVQMNPVFIQALNQKKSY